MGVEGDTDMRKGYNNGMLVNGGGELLGINFGADYCAEHEWGIEKIRKAFGVPETGQGLIKRQITLVPNTLEWVQFKNCEGFWIKPWRDGKIEDYNFPIGKELYTAWSGKDFGVFSTNPKEVSKLREVFEAIQRLDAAMWLGGGGVFKNAGFVICIASRLSKEMTDRWELADKESEKLKADFAATGIEEKLKKAGKGYYALTPRRGKGNSLMFWLNPMEQDRYNHGWYKLGELEQWIQNRGPIVKKNQDRR